MQSPSKGSDPEADKAKADIEKLNSSFFSPACELISELTELKIDEEKRLKRFEISWDEKQPAAIEDSLNKKGIDWLGCYSCGKSGPKIELFAHNIRALAKFTNGITPVTPVDSALLAETKSLSLDKKIQSIARVVLLHEIAHYYTHKGHHKRDPKDIRRLKYKSWKAFDKAKPCVIEGLAQYWTDEALPKVGAPDSAILIPKHVDRAYFDYIAEKAPVQYRAHIELRNMFEGIIKIDDNKIAEGSSNDWVKMHFEHLKRSNSAEPKILKDFLPERNPFYVKCLGSRTKFLLKRGFDTKSLLEQPSTGRNPEQKPFIPEKVPRP